ncbi:hypothetical protein ACP70R_033128 [Stipagrostis hirtigluma subsp. patula]
METHDRPSSLLSQGKTSRLLQVVAFSSCVTATVLALVTVVAATVGAEHQSTSGIATPAASMNITAICRPTPYPRACETALSSPDARSVAGDPFTASVRFAISQAASALALVRNLSAPAPPQSGLHDCVLLLDISLDQLRDALAGATADPEGATTWLSAALTNQDTCNDSLAVVPASAGREAVRRQVGALAEFISTALALHVGKVRVRGRRSGAVPGAAPAPSPNGNTFPSWVSEDDRRLLESPATTVVTPDAVVALDGSGTHRSIGEAIADVTAATGRHAGRAVVRKVIHVKAGRYVETVTISKDQTHMMLVGDGMGKTIIVGSKSVADGYTIFSSATVAAMGPDFIAKGLSIINSAGPGKGQAVALSVGGDRSVVYQCSIEGYQNTLFTQFNRQFYGENDIFGTVDLIFGNAAVVFQRCNIHPRKPNPGLVDVITAQGRADMNQNTGISIQFCRITGAADLGSTPVYLGRPRRKYARTVVMESFLDGSIAPAGWKRADESPWVKPYYGEFVNIGPGAATNGRVTLLGVHRSMTTLEAVAFTVKFLIQGDSWLPSTGVNYTSGLIFALQDCVTCMNQSK